MKYGFASGFAKDLEDMITLKTSFGFSEATYLDRARDFDRYCATEYPDADRLTEPITVSWLKCEWHNKNTHFYRRKFPTLLCLKASYRYTESVTKILRLRRHNNYAGGRYENNDSNVIQERV